jgi:glycosyltransferase involved in cell wall biosynthesis
MEVSGKKILYLVTKGNWGGAQRYVFDLATALHAKGARVSVAYGAPGQLGGKLRAAGIRTIELPALARDVSLFADIRSYRQIARMLRTERPDVLHLNSSKAGALGALAGRLAGVPCIIFTAHGWAFNENRNLLSRGIIWLISWFTALLCHHIIAVSNHELRAAKRMPFCAKKAVRIYNGIDLHMSFGSGEIIRNAFPAGVQITGTVGELIKNKNQTALIEEARTKPDMYVAIVGEGELRGVLEKKIKEYGLEQRVKLFGFLPARDVMRGFDRFALPSIKEGLGYVILEARAAGLPIVANRVGGVGEALDTDLSEFSLERMVEQTVALYHN